VNTDFCIHFDPFGVIFDFRSPPVLMHYASADPYLFCFIIKFITHTTSIRTVVPKCCTVL